MKRFFDQDRQSLGQQIKREIVHIPRLFPYLMVVFIWILHYPAIHLLALPTLIMLVVIFAWELLAYTLRIWTQRPSKPPVTFQWWRVWENLLTFIGPFAFLALLMFLNHYPWQKTFPQKKSISERTDASTMHLSSLCV